MPDIALHNIMGRIVYQSLNEEIQQMINKRVFSLALNGPDLFSFYNIFLKPFRKGINYRSGIMHDSKTGEYLIQLAKIVIQKKAFHMLQDFFVIMH